MTTLSDRFKLMSINFNKFKGFTLIELLIVVAIISILVSIGAVSFSRVQIQGRDTTRKADLQEVASALEQFYSDNSTYPESSGSSDFKIKKCDASEIDWGAASPNPFDCPTESIIYLAEMPEDPQGTTPQYRYQSTTAANGVCKNNDPLIPTCQRFTLSAKLEREDNLNCDGLGGGSDAYDLCVRNP